MERVVELIDRALTNSENENALKEIKEEVNSWMSAYPLFASETIVNQ
jgi:glycine hydroxymethyltransferase